MSAYSVKEISKIEAFWQNESLLECNVSEQKHNLIMHVKTANAANVNPPNASCDN